MESFFYNISPLLRKSIFSRLMSKYCIVSAVFQGFQYENLRFMQNEYDIRNQHKKRHRKMIASSNNSFRQNSTLSPLSLFWKDDALHSPTGQFLTERVV
jgi:hypothetical protein